MTRPGKEPDHFEWIHESGLMSELNKRDLIGCYFPFLLPLICIPLLIWKPGLWWILIPVIPLIAGARRYSNYLFFHRIVCPKCGFNPTRGKSDGAPRKDEFKVMAQLRSFKDCPNCGEAKSGKIPEK